MEGQERNAQTKGETNGREQSVAVSEGKRGSEENSGGGYFSAQLW